LTNVRVRARPCNIHCSLFAGGRYVRKPDSSTPIPMRKRHLILCCLIVMAMVRPAAAQNIDPALKADITRLIDLLNATQNLEELSGVVADAMLTSMRSAHPDAPPRVLAVVNEIVKKKFSDALGGRDGLLSRVVPIYAKYYTREDIQGLIAFYQSDVGRKAIM